MIVGFTKNTLRDYLLAVNLFLCTFRQFSTSIFTFWWNYNFIDCTEQKRFTPFFLSVLWFIPYPLPAIKKKKKTLYMGANVFSRKVLVGDTTFTSPTGDGITIFHGHLSLLFATQRQYLHFSVMLRPWVLVRTRESNLGLPLCSQLAYWLN